MCKFAWCTYARKTHSMLCLVIVRRNGTEHMYVHHEPPCELYVQRLFDRDVTMVDAKQSIKLAFHSALLVRAIPMDPSSGLVATRGSDLEC